MNEFLIQFNGDVWGKIVVSDVDLSINLYDKNGKLGSLFMEPEEVKLLIKFLRGFKFTKQ